VALPHSKPIARENNVIEKTSHNTTTASSTTYLIIQYRFGSEGGWCCCAREVSVLWQQTKHEGITDRQQFGEKASTKMQFLLFAMRMLLKP